MFRLVGKAIGSVVIAALPLCLFAACDPATRYAVLQVVFDDVPEPGTVPAPRRPRRVRRELPARLRLARAPGTPTPVATPAPEGPPIEEASELGLEAALALLPTSFAGGPDWVAALREAIILPRTSRDAVGPPPHPLLLDVELEPEDATMLVVFPHAAHTRWLRCPNCHPAIFEMKKGADPITMTKILNGEYCGRCHGKMAFDLGSCGRCHVKLRPPGPEVVESELANAVTPGDGARLAARGAAIYRAKCMICHGETGDGNGPLASVVFPKPRNFTSGTFKFRSTPGGTIPTDRDLFRTITAGVPGTSMPAWVALSAMDRWALVHYVKTFSDAFAKGEPMAPLSIPSSPALTPELLEEGKQLFADAGCNACHGNEGRGDGESAVGLKDDWGFPIRPFNFTGMTPMKSGSDPRDVYRTIMTGLTGTPMPSFGDVLEPAMAWALVHYVRSLRPATAPAEWSGLASAAGPGSGTISQLLLDELAAAAREPMTSSPELLETGNGLYATYCAICHGENGDGKGRAARLLDPKPRDFTAGKFKFRTTPGGSIPSDADIYRTIVVGVPGTSMPAWSTFSPEEKWGLVHYVKTFSGEFAKEVPAEALTIPDPPPMTPELQATGKTLFADAGCNACHGDEGRGDGPSAAGLKDDWGYPIRPFNFTSTSPMKSGPMPQDVYRTIMTGLTGTPMPSFGDVLEPEMAWALVAHVWSLRPDGLRWPTPVSQVAGEAEVE